MDLADAADIVFGNVPAPCCHSRPLLDLDLHGLGFAIGGVLVGGVWYYSSHEEAIVMRLLYMCAHVCMCKVGVDT